MIVHVGNPFSTALPSAVECQDGISAYLSKLMNNDGNEDPALISALTSGWAVGYPSH